MIMFRGEMNDIARNLKHAYSILDQLKTHGVVDESWVEVIQQEDSQIDEHDSCYTVVEKLQANIIKADVKLKEYQAMDDWDWFTENLYGITAKHSKEEEK
tara:strand:+ start:150 stop:449 length:300 start_codon:yes stop_codon:yes gene_type:complete